MTGPIPGTDEFRDALKPIVAGMPFLSFGDDFFDELDDEQVQQCLQPDPSIESPEVYKSQVEGTFFEATKDKKNTQNSPWWQFWR